MRLKSLNKALITMLLSVTVLMSVSTVAYSAGKSAAEHVKAAKAILSKKKLSVSDLRKAFIEAAKALRKAPKNVEAHLILARLNRLRRKTKLALAHYATVAKLDPKNIESREKLSTFFIQFYSASRDKKALAQAVIYNDQLLKLKPKSINGLSIKAAISLAQGKKKLAMKLANQVLKRKPTNYFAVMTKVNIYIISKKVGKATSLLRRTLNKTKNPKQILRLTRILTRAYLRQKRFNKATALLTKQVMKYPKIPALSLELIRLYVASKQKIKAKGIYLHMMKKNPKNIKMRAQYIFFLKQFFGNKAAFAKLNQFIRKYKKEYRFRLMKANLYLKIKKPAKAIALYKKMIKQYGDKPAGTNTRLQYTKLLMAMRKYKEADAQISHVISKHPKFLQAIMVKAHIAMRLGNPKQAIALYQGILKKNPKATVVMKQLAIAYHVSNKPKLAKELIEKVIKSHPKDLGAATMLAKLYAREGKLKLAQKQFESVLKRAPKHFLTLRALVGIQIQNKDFAGAKKNATTLAKLYPKQPLGNYLLGLVAQSSGKHKEAIKYFKKTAKKQPKSYYPIAAMARSYMLLGKTAVAIKMVNRVIAKNPKNTAAITLLGRLYVKSKNIDKAEKALKKAIKAKPKHTSGYYNLTGFYVAFRKNNKAIATLKQGIKKHPRNAAFKYMLATILQRTGKSAEAQKLYERLLKTNPGHSMVVNNLALLLVNKGKDSKAISRALSLVKKLRSTKNPYLLDTIGWVNYKAGKFDAALASLKKALQRLPKDADVNFHLGMTYYRKKNLLQAKKHLELAISSKSSFRGRKEAKSTLAKLGK